MESISITVDTNCLNAEGKLGPMNDLEVYANRGQVSLFKTDVLDTELQQESPGPEAARRKEKSQSLPEDIGPLVIGHSRIGHTRLAGESTQAELDELTKLLLGRSFRQVARNGETRSVRDVMHLYTHIRHGRDYFVTKDRLFLEKQDAIREQYGTRVGSPAECLEFLEERARTADSPEGHAE